MNKKGTAIEDLLSGNGMWLLVVLIVGIGFLVFIFIVLSPEPSECRLGSRLECLSHTYENEELTINVKNTNGQDMIGLAIEIPGCEEVENDIVDGELGFTKTATFKYRCNKEDLDAEAVVRFTNVISGLEHTKKGTIR